MAQRTLTDLENRILDVAEAQPDLKFPHVVAEFGWRRPVYLMRLFRLVDDPAAERERALVVRRVRRLRDRRAAARASRRFAS